MKKIFCIAASLVLVTGAQAQQGKPASGYLTLSGGKSSYDVDCAGTVACDKGGSAVRLLGGYRLGSGFGVEGLYLGLGKSSASVNLAGTGVVGVELKSTAIGAGMAFYMPFGNFEAAARLGLASVNTKVSGRIGAGNTVSVANERKVKPYVGMNMSYAFSSNVALDVSLDSTQFEALDDKARVLAFAVGLSLRF